MIIEKTTEINEIINYLQSKDVVLSGPTGAGKKTIAKQVKATLDENGYHCILCELNTQYLRNTDIMLNIVHQLAESFETTNFNKNNFDLVDLVYCEKFNLLPRNFFKNKEKPDLLSEVFSLSEKIVDLTSLGVAPKILSITQNLYKIMKDVDDKQEIKRLKSQDKDSLLQEFKPPLLQDQHSQIVLILTNFDAYDVEVVNYLYSLREINQNIKFIYITEKPTHYSADLQVITTEGFSSDEIKKYLKDRLKNLPSQKQQQAEAFFEEYDSALPSYIEAFCMIFEKEDGIPSEMWEISAQMNHLWENISKDLSQDKKDILILLSICPDVTIQVFELFFENLYFGNYIDWFETPLFEYDNHSVNLKHFYKKAIIPHCNKILLSSYYKKLIQLHLKLLEESLQTQEIENIHQNFSKVFKFFAQEQALHPQQTETSTQDLLFDILNKYWNIATVFCLDMIFVSKYEELFLFYTGQKKMICRSKIISTYISHGMYELAKGYLLPQWEQEEKNIALIEVLKSSLIYYQNAESTATSSGKRYDILLAENILDIYSNLDVSLEKKYNDQIYLNTYIAKAYMAGIDPSQSRKYLDKAFSVPDEAISLFQLFKNTAFAYMVSGELYTVEKDLNNSMKELEKAEHYYKYTTILDHHDVESMSNLGLVHKRISENYQILGDTPKVESAMIDAIKIYQQVKIQNETLIDIYQKLGYANSELSMYLLGKTDNEKPLMYCKEAIKILEEGLHYLIQMSEDHRQIRNALCQSYRNLFIMTEKPEFLEYSFLHAQKSIACASENVLGYTGFLRTAKVAQQSNLLEPSTLKEVENYLKKLNSLSAQEKFINLAQEILDSV